MVGIVKNPTVGIPSAKALGGRETSKKKLDLEPLVSDFNLLMLAAEANKSQMDKIVSDRLKEKGPKPSTDPKENPTELRRKIAENFFAEVLTYYRDIEKYKATFTPEFIQLFNPEDQLFLSKMVQELKIYLADHAQYIAKLLPLFGYEDIDAFVDDLTQVGEAGEVINSAHRKSISRAVVMDEIIEEEGFFSKIAKALSAKKEVPAKKAETPKEEEDRFSKLIKVAGATKESIAKHLADKLDDEKAAVFFEMARDHMQASADANAHLYAYASAFNKLLVKYADSSLAEDAQRQKECSQRIAGLGSSSDLESTIRTMVLNRRVLPFNDIAHLIDETWVSPAGEKVSAIVQDFRVAVAKNAEQLTEVKRVVDDTFTAIETARLLRIEESRILNKLSKITSNATGTAAANISKAAEVAATKIESVVDAIRERLSLRADVPFSDFSHFVQDRVAAFNSVGEELNDERLKGWKFIYDRNSKALTEIPDNLDVKDTVKIEHDGAHVFTVVPTNIERTSEGKTVAKGVSVTVHRHERKDMDLAVLMMLEAMPGKKEICISIDTAATIEAKAIIYAYAQVILRHSAIPMLMGENGKALNRKESRLKLQEIEDELFHGKKAPSTSISEKYSAQVKRIKTMKIEGKKFLKQFDLAIQQPMGTTTDAEEKILNDIKQLMIIALIDRNLTERDLVERIVKSAQRMLPEAQALSDDAISAIQEKVLFKLRSYVLKNSEFKESSSPIDFGDPLFSLAKTSLKEYVFLKDFDLFMENSPSPLDRMERSDIIARLHFARINKNLDTDALVNRIVAYAQKTSSDRETSFTATELKAIEKELKAYFDECSAKNPGFLLTDFVVQLYNLAAKKLRSTNVIPTVTVQKEASSQLYTKLASEPKAQPAPELSSEDKDELLAAIDSVVQKIESSSESVATPKLNSSLLDKIKEGVPLNHVSQEEIDQLKRAKENKKSEDPLVEELGKRRIGVAGDDNEDSSDWDDVDEDESIAQKRAKYAVQKILPQKAQVEPLPKSISDNATNLVGVYSVTENDISEFNLPEPAAEFKGLVQETEKVSAEKFDLSQKATSAPKDNGAPTVSAAAAPKAATAAAMSQHSREEMLRQLRKGQSSLKPATVQPKPNADKPQGMLDSVSKMITAKKNQVFLRQFDALLQEYKYSKEHHGITMQDPDTGKQLDELAILTRLAEIAFVHNGMTPEAFIDRAITFGLVTLAPSAQATVTDQDMSDLKKQLQEKVRLHLLHTAVNRDEGLFAAHLIQFAQHEWLPGHVVEDSKNYGMFPVKDSSCAASVREENKSTSVKSPTFTSVGS